MLVYQRVYPMNIPLNHYKIPLTHYKIPFKSHQMFISVANLLELGGTTFCTIPLRRSQGQPRQKRAVEAQDAQAPW